jgi:hypothetical protein
MRTPDFVSVTKKMRLQECEQIGVINILVVLMTYRSSMLDFFEGK